MSELTYRDWLFNWDRDKTHKAYEGILVGGVESCECSGCRNFLAQREVVFPAEIMTLFSQLGVNYKRDAEIYHIAQLESGLHLYGGWFHFIGVFPNNPSVPQR